METTTEQYVPVTEQFWQELSDFLTEESITAMDLKRAGLNYNTAQKIVKGTRATKRVSAKNMMMFKDIVGDPSKYRVNASEVVTSLDDMLGINLTSDK
jgi:predicted transcriptional regulator